MRPEIKQAIMNSDRRAVQTRGLVTLPKGWRDEHGIEDGDEVIVREADDGTLEIIAPE